MEFTYGIADLLQPGPKAWLEEDILPQYLKARRWFASKDKAIQSVRLSHAGLANFDDGQLLFGEIDVEVGDTLDRYQLPLGLWYANDKNAALAEQLKLADILNAGEQCIITDAFSLDSLPRALLGAMRTGQVFHVDQGEIQCLALPGFTEALESAGQNIIRLSAEQSNSSLVIGDRLIMKLIRRVMSGINPEVEMVRYLTENFYANTPPLLGEVRQLRHDGSSYSMLVVQKFIANQGDAWSYTLETLALHPASNEGYRHFVAMVGTRLGQLHEVLARPTDVAAFAPRLAEESDIDEWIAEANRQVVLAIAVLRNFKNMDDALIKDRDFVLVHHQTIIAALSTLGRAGLGSLLTRVHGDFHLGQILVADNDVYIIDFEGEPSKSLDMRRKKSSPMRDVAGLLRSLQYAAGASDTPPPKFVHEMAAVFLSAYRDVHRNAERRWCDDERQEGMLLDLFLLEKCAYEICYEAANRPSWLPIPLQGFAGLVANILRRSPEINDA
jgi:maltose alpha-D-glucosyltransferase/alpha-amylase